MMDIVVTSTLPTKNREGELCHAMTVRAFPNRIFVSREAMELINKATAIQDLEEPSRKWDITGFISRL